MTSNHTRLLRLAPLFVLVAICSCASPRLSDEVPDVARGFKPHVEQVLDNIAAFTKDPGGAWPSHVLVYKGTLETRRQWTGSGNVGGTDGFTGLGLEGSAYGMTRWELSVLDDPYDIRRVRLLYQWQVGHIDFDTLESRWNEIRDRAVLDGSGKPVRGEDGRPKFLPVPLPVARDTPRDWTTNKLLESTDAQGGWTGRRGPPRENRVWVTNTEAETEFCLAILSAMANTRVRARWGDAAMMTP